MATDPRSPQYVAPYVRLAVENILYDGLDDIFYPKPFEIDFLLEDVATRTAIENHVTRRLVLWISGTERIGGTVQPVFIPKPSGGLRKCAFIDIEDCIFITAHILMVAESIEQFRIAKHLGKLFSYRYLPEEGQLFDCNYNYTAFRKETGRKLRNQNVAYLVEADISNFYDRVGIHVIETQLVSAGVNQLLVSAINDLLLHLSGRKSYGLPVGINASRILAEVALSRIDHILAHKGIDFIRFVDDYRLFAPNLSTAHYWLETLSELLSEDGLYLGSGKTQIRPNISSPEEFKETIDEWNAPTTPGESHGRKSAAPFTQYSGIVPLRFKIPSQWDQDSLKKEDLNSIIDTLTSSYFNDQGVIAKALKCVYAQKSWDSLERILPLIIEIPRCLPYFVDFLLKIGDVAPEDVRKRLSECLAEKLTDANISNTDYAILWMIKLLGTAAYNERGAILRFYLLRPAGAKPVIGREIILSLREGFTAEDFAQLKSRVPYMHPMEIRALVSVASDVIYVKEFEPWLKYISGLAVNDIVLTEQVRKVRTAHK